jgi:hypothetical protein
MKYCVYSLKRGWWTGCGWTLFREGIQWSSSGGEMEAKAMRMIADGIPSAVHTNVRRENEYENY